MYICICVCIYTYIHVGNACRKIATTRLPQQFGSPEVAEKELEKQTSPETRTIPATTQCAMPNHDTPELIFLSQTECTDNIKVLMSKVKDEDKPSVLSLLYSDLAASQYGLKIPNDYLQLSLYAFKHLKESGRANVLYKLAKAIGEIHSDGSDTKLPCKQMPMGLLEHIANFLLLNLIIWYNYIAIHHTAT